MNISRGGSSNYGTTVRAKNGNNSKKTLEGIGSEVKVNESKKVVKMESKGKSTVERCEM